MFFFDGQGELSPNALYEIAMQFYENPRTDVVYFDQDEIDPRTKRRSNPWFKPDASPELLLSVDYLQACVMRSALLEGMPAVGYPQDENGFWALHLAAARRAERVEHIPKVLYHRHRRSFAEMPDSAREDRDGGEDIQMHPPAQALAQGGAAGVRASRHATGEVQLLWPPGERLVSVVIPTRDNLPYLRRCLQSLQARTNDEPCEILLVDTGSEDPNALAFYERLEESQQVRMLRLAGPFNYSKANNFGASQARGDLLLFLNDDVHAFEAGWLQEMVRWCSRDEVGVVGAKLLFPSGHIQHAGIVIGLGGIAGHVFRGMREVDCGPFGSPNWYRNLSAVTGACMMLPRDVFNQVGGFDERFRVAYGDVDLCLRIREAGYRVLYTPFARLIHHEGASRGRHTPGSDLALARERFSDLLEKGDPYFNPNLSPRSVMPRARFFGMHVRR